MQKREGKKVEQNFDCLISEFSKVQYFIKRFYRREIYAMNTKEMNESRNQYGKARNIII